MQAEESRGIAFVDGDFEVAGGVERSEFFAFGHVGIGFGDAVNNLVAFEYDAEMAAFALFLELFAGNVDDDVFKMVNENDLSFYPVAAKSRPKGIFSMMGTSGMPIFCNFSPACRRLMACPITCMQYKVFLTADFSSGSPITIAGFSSSTIVISPLSAQSRYCSL